jgi:DNA-directed RNA polymerase subunit M/transcription elongation factor TFIIS
MVTADALPRQTRQRIQGSQAADPVQCLRDQPRQTLSRSNEMKKQIPVWECPRCSYVMTAEEEIGDEEELLAEFERVRQTIAEGERDPKPGDIAQCFRCGKFAVIGEDLQLRMPTTDEQLAIQSTRTRI